MKLLPPSSGIITMELKIGPHSKPMVVYFDELAFKKQQDWRYMPREAFYEKYPEAKPIHPLAKVTLDEADKK